MLDLSIRINAMICYLFLGPCILLAKTGTPLADSYVQAHARRSSIIILIGVVAFGIYTTIRPLILGISLFSISLSTLILSLLMSTLLLFLVIGAYGAYHGTYASSQRNLGFSFTTKSEQSDTSEEEKVRIIAALLPFLGIFLAQKYPLPEVLLMRKIANFMTFLILSSTVIFGSIQSITFLLIVLYIGIFVFTAVKLFGFGELFIQKWYHFVPTYTQIEAGIYATFVSLYDTIRIVFGGEKKNNFHDTYASFTEKYQEIEYIETNFLVPNWIFAIPVINLIGIRAYSPGYNKYRGLAAQGFGVTIIFLLLWFWYGIGSEIGLYLLFPLCTLMSTGKNISTRAPLVSICIGISDTITILYRQLSGMSQKKDGVHFEYKDEK